MRTESDLRLTADKSQVEDSQAGDLMASDSQASELHSTNRSAVNSMANGLPERREKPTLLCFSHLRWDFVFQRPQHLLTRAARTRNVIFFEEPIHGDVEHARLRLSSPVPGVTVATPVLQHGANEDEAAAIQRTLLDDLLENVGINTADQDERLITWYFTPMALRFSAHLKPRACIYDCMDELSNFRGAPEKLKNLERSLFARSQLVFTGGQSLYEAKRRQHDDVHAFPSSIDAPHFGGARHSNQPDPADQAGIAHPRIGFFGVIDERFDTSLLDDVARLRPDWQFVMIGPVVKIDPSTLPRNANIHWLGRKSYDELPSYLSGWDLGFMPFALNDATRYISPTKTPEFLAAGLPVVSTAVLDVVRTYGNSGLVEIAHGAVDAVRKASFLLGRPRAAWLAKVDAFLATTSWDRTWDAMERLIERQRPRVGFVPPAARMPATHEETAHV